MSHGLFAINVLPVSQRFKGTQGVPVIGGCHYHRVDVIACAKLTKIGVGVAAFKGMLLRILSVMLFDVLLRRLAAQSVSFAWLHVAVMQIVYIAYRHHLDVFLLEEVSEI